MLQLLFSDIFVLLAHYGLTIGQTVNNRYTSDSKYYKYSQGLTAIPTDIPTDALEVYIWFNRITRIETNVFARLSQCIVLQLVSNQITEVESGAFNGLRVLTILYLSKNNLERLHKNMFSHLQNCKRLNLHSNRISGIEPEWIE